MLGRVSTVQECYKLTKAKAYSAFGVQYGGECWSSEDAVERYDRYGKGRTCSNGMGGRWTQNVYIITGNKIELNNNNNMYSSNLTTIMTKPMISRLTTTTSDNLDSYEQSAKYHKYIIPKINTVKFR